MRDLGLACGEWLSALTARRHPDVFEPKTYAPRGHWGWLIIGALAVVLVVVLIPVQPEEESPVATATAERTPQRPRAASTPRASTGVVLTASDRECRQWAVLAGANPPSEAQIRANYGEWRRDVLPSCTTLAASARDVCAAMDEAGLDPYDGEDLDLALALFAPHVEFDQIFGAVLTWCD